MKIGVEYDDADDSSGSTSSDDSIEELNVKPKGRKKKPMTSLASSTPPPTALDSDESSISDSSLMGVETPATNLAEVDDWQFNLDVMNDRHTKMEEATKDKAFTTYNSSKDFDTMSKLSIMSDDLTIISKELEAADRAIERVLADKEEAVKEFRNPCARRVSGGGRALTPAFLEQRKKDRVVRLARARQRIEKEKALAKRQEEEENIRQAKREAKANKPAELDMSEAARRDRAYQWYSRCGQPNRKDLKRRIAVMKKSDAGVSTEDVDLLPWNFNGSLINVSKMISMSLGN